MADCVRVVRRPPGTQAEPQAGPLALQVADAVTHLRPDSEHVQRFQGNSLGLGTHWQSMITGVTVTVGAEPDSLRLGLGPGPMMIMVLVSESESDT
jgi:hypothetical protein